MYDSETMNLRTQLNVYVVRHVPIVGLEYSLWDMITDLRSSSIVFWSSRDAGYASAYYITLRIPFLRARTKTAQNDRCKNLDSRLPMTKFIFLDTPPTSNRRKITILEGDFFLSQVDQLFFAKFDFKVAFAMDPRWSTCAGIVPRTRITWRLEQLFKSLWDINTDLSSSRIICGSFHNAGCERA